MGICQSFSEYFLILYFHGAWHLTSISFESGAYRGSKFSKRKGWKKGSFNFYNKYLLQQFCALFHFSHFSSCTDVKNQLTIKIQIMPVRKKTTLSNCSSMVAISPFSHNVTQYWTPMSPPEALGSSIFTSNEPTRDPWELNIQLQWAYRIPSIAQFSTTMSPSKTLRNSILNSNRPTWDPR